MTKTELKQAVDQTKAKYWEIQHREWNGQRYGMSEMDMWQEASQGAGEWAEIVRVLAQGEDYYGIDWGR